MTEVEEMVITFTSGGAAVIMLIGLLSVLGV